MKKFFGEFKKFITRGNVLDMAVGVIVGGAFTAIVNGLTNNILKPLINYLLSLILKKDALTGARYPLGEWVYNAEGAIDYASSIYIDLGAFITAIIDFLLIATVLFLVVKTINAIKEGNGKMKEKIKENTLDRKERKELKAAGVNIRDKKAVKEYFEKKKADEQAAIELAKAEAQAKALEERLKNPTTEDLLKQIIKLLEDKKA